MGEAGAASTNAGNVQSGRGQEVAKGLGTAGWSRSGEGQADGGGRGEESGGQIVGGQE